MRTQPRARSPAPERDRQPVVEMRGITIRFPGVRALDDVDFRLLPRRGARAHGRERRRQVHPDQGAHRRLHRSTPARSSSPARSTCSPRPADAQAAGISTVYQEVNLCPNLSVGENIMLGHEPRRSAPIDWRAMHRPRPAHLEQPRPRHRHPLAARRATRSRSSSWSRSPGRWYSTPGCSSSTSRPRAWTRRGRAAVRRHPRPARPGVAILFVTHFLDQVYEISDRITVLRNGQLVGEYLVAETAPRRAGDQDDRPRARRCSTSSTEAAERGRRPSRHAACSRRVGLGRRGVARAADLDVYEGEVVGIAGLLGSGRTELARLLYGADRADTGELDRCAPRGAGCARPRHAIDRNDRVLLEDRKAEGIVGDLTVAENIVLALQAARGWLRRIPQATRDAPGRASTSRRSTSARPTRTRSCATCRAATSRRCCWPGGWRPQPELLILDEPTRGIDVGAKAEIQRKVAELAAQGMSVIFISSELEEVLRLSDRIVVMRDRRKIGEHDQRRRQRPTTSSSSSQRGPPEGQPCCVPTRDSVLRHRLFWPVARPAGADRGQHDRAAAVPRRSRCTTASSTAPRSTSCATARR